MRTCIKLGKEKVVKMGRIDGPVYSFQRQRPASFCPVLTNIQLTAGLCVWEDGGELSGTKVDFIGLS